MKVYIYRNLKNLIKTNKKSKLYSYSEAIKDIHIKVASRPKFHPTLMDRTPFLKYAAKPEHLPQRTLRDSFTSVIVPLSTNKSLQNQYVSSSNEVRLGQVLYDIDYFAAWVLFAYIDVKNPDPNLPERFVPYTFYTLFVDQVHFYPDYVAKVRQK